MKISSPRTCVTVTGSTFGRSNKPFFNHGRTATKKFTLSRALRSHHVFIAKILLFFVLKETFF